MSDSGGPIRPLEPGAQWAFPEGTSSSASPPLGAIFKRRRWTIGAFLGVTILLALAYKGTQKPVYTSSATILVEGKDGGGNALDQLGQVGAVSQVQTEMGMIRSRRVIGPVVDELDLHVSVAVDGADARPDGLFEFFDAGPEAPVGSFTLRASADGSVAVFADDGRFPLAMGSLRDTLTMEGLRIAVPEKAFWREIHVEIQPFSRAVEGAMDRISVRSQDPTAELIEIMCQGRDPNRARDLCDGVADSYLRLRTVLQRTEASSTAAFLGEQVTVARSHLTAMEDSLQRFAVRNRIVALEEQASEEVRRRVSLDAERLDLDREYEALAGLVQRIERAGPAVRIADGARTDGARTGGARTDGASSRRSVAKSLRMAGSGSMAGGGGAPDSAPVSARYRDLASFPRFLQQGAVTQLVSTLVSLENQRAELGQRRRSNSPEMVALSQRLLDVEGQLGSFAASYLESLDSQRRALDKPLAESALRLDALPAQQVTYARMERQAGLLSDLYGFLETRRREAEVAKQVELPSVRILDRASLPYEPTSPSWALSLMAALVFGLSGGVVTAFYREHADTTLYARRDVERGTGLPVISMIPRLPKGGAVFDGQIMRRSVPSSAGSARKEEVVREAFRGLLTDMEYRRRQLGGAPLRSVAIVSAGPGEGKTFTASNIALAHASVGARTLLVDADMRAGGVSEFFGMPTLSGLSEVLSGEASPEEVVRLLKIEKANHRSTGALAVLPAGAPTSLSAALLHGRAMESVLEAVKEQFDLIVIDTAPLNVLSDAMPVAAAVDGVLLVVRGGRTDRDALEHTLNRLDRVGANILGIVLNDSEAPRSYGVYSTAYSLNA